MTIIHHDDWDLSERGKKDAERHREKIDDAIRKNVQDVIGEESIITKRKGKKIKIPVKGLKDYRFIYGNNGSGSVGAGQGETDKDGTIGKRTKQNNDNTPGGEGNGEDYMETEVDIDYLIEIMFDDLGLPYIEEKTKKEILVPKGWKFESISKKGILPRIHKKRTMIEAAKRMASYEMEIINETNCTEDDAKKSLMQANGNLIEAINIIKEGKLNGYEPGVFIEDDDLRFKQIETDIEYHSKAVVIAMMDTSGSMDREKKYLARSMLFWMVEFLKKCYNNVDIRFIVHTTEARLVDEDIFFHKGEAGGTLCHTAFDKANYMIDTEYPLDEWNVYCIYIGDGEDWNPEKTCTSIKNMLDKKVNMVGYTEISIDAGSTYGGVFPGNNNTLIKHILNKWKFSSHREGDTDFYRNDKERFLLSIIRNKSHVYSALKHYLFQPKGNIKL